MQIVFRNIQHSVGKTPFVVEPGQDVHQPRAGNSSLTGIDDGRMWVMVEITTGVRQLGVGQKAFERAMGGGLAQNPVDLGGDGIGG